MVNSALQGCVNHMPELAFMKCVDEKYIMSGKTWSEYIGPVYHTQKVQIQTDF